MFENFTERARKVMSLARQEAQRLNSEFIGTEHMLLAIIKEGGGTANMVLKKFEVSMKKICQEIEKLITPSTSPTVTLGQLPFSPRAKRVIELASEASSQLGHDVIGTEHILLGLVKENEGIAAQVLINMGLKIDAVRDMVLEVLGKSEALGTFGEVGDTKDETPKERLLFRIELISNHGESKVYMSPAPPDITYRDDGRLIVQWKKEDRPVTLIVSQEHSVLIRSLK